MEEVGIYNKPVCILNETKNTIDYRENQQNFNYRRCYKPGLPLFFRIDHGKSARRWYTTT